jgi:pyruvate dehydrogenase E1 component alpha subunit
MDVLKVLDASKEALDYVRNGNGPYFMEIMTYRFRGHSMGDPERYRKSDEVKKWQENDPIGIYRNHLIQKDIFNDAELDQIDKKAQEEVNAAVQFAESSPEPAPEELFTHIYVEN